MPVSFRDRFFTPPVARAITSPGAIVLAGVGGAAGILLGLGPIGAVLAAAVAYGGRIAAAIPRGQKGPRIDPFALQEPWRSYVQEALQAKARFDRSVTATRPGPLKDRLAELGDRIAQGIEDCWRIAGRGDDIDQALSTLDTRSAHAELAALQQAGGAAPDSSRAKTIESLQAQLASADRLARVSTDAQDRLRLLDARLDELVARTVELSIGPADGDVGGLHADVDGLVTEMEALRLAIEETDTP